MLGFRHSGRKLGGLFVVEDDLERSPLYYRFLKVVIMNISPSIYGASLQRPRFGVCLVLVSLGYSSPLQMLMTWELAGSGDEFVTCVINGADFVPTFSSASVDDLRAEGIPDNRGGEESSEAIRLRRPNNGGSYKISAGWKKFRRNQAMETGGRIWVYGRGDTTMMVLYYEPPNLV